MKENDKIGYVYLTTNLINGKQYVGQHLSDGFDKYYKGSGTYIKRALDKYGWNNFTCEVLQWCTTQTQLNEVEDNFIRLYGTMVPNGYNLKGGGSNGKHSEEARKNMSEAHKGQVSWNKGKKASEEYRENLSKGQQKRWEKTEEHKKISKTLKKYFESEENRKKTAEATKKYFESEKGKLSREKMSEANKGRIPWNKGKHHTEEACKKMSEAAKGRKRKPLSEETKQKISKANKGRVGAMTGKHHTEETRKKISEANKRNKNALGHRHTEETRKKISETEKGKVVSTETRKKLSKTVYQYTNYGEFIKEWMSSIEIQNQLGFDHRNISACCRGKLKTFKGFKWSFELLN